MNAREIFERRLRQAVKASAREVQTAAQNNHKFTSRTGQLERAIDVRMIGDKTAEVYIDSQAAYHGPFVHEGTQPHDIFPKRIMSRAAAIAVTKTDQMRIFDPNTTQQANAWSIDYRKFHDVWVPKNRLASVWANFGA